MPSGLTSTEFGIVAAVGRNGVEQLLGVVADANDKRLPRLPVRVWRLSVSNCGY